jgi:hypothetical protein
MQPDISFATVHQCAWYSSSLTALHELAMKRIGRYLLATSDKGLILHPIKMFALICVLTPTLWPCGTGNIPNSENVLCLAQAL